MPKKWVEEYDQKLQESTMTAHSKMKPCSLSSKTHVLTEDISSRNHPEEAAKKRREENFGVF